MSKENYTKFSENTENEVVNEGIVNNEVTEEIPQIEPEVITEPDVDVNADSGIIGEPGEEAKPLYGVVTGCKRLNVREQPSKESKPLHVVSEGDEFLINTDFEDENFHEVIFGLNEEYVVGYCMKQFISIK